MGYMTTVTILNDGWSNIKNNPNQFIDNISLGMNGINKFDRLNRKRINSYSVGNHCNPMGVAISHHADEPRLYLVYQNMMTTVGYANDLEDLELRKNLLKVAKRLIKNEEDAIKKLEQNIKNSNE